MRVSTRLAAVVGITALSFSMSAAAYAATWGVRTSTYNGVVRVQGYGSFYNNAGTATSTVTTQDRANDGNSVHATTMFLAYYTSTGASYPEFHMISTKSTPAFSNTLMTQTVTQNYSAYRQGTNMRGEIQSCAQMGRPVPDSCTDPAVLTVSY